MSVVPIIASVDDLPNAIRYADRKPAARWYVAKRCEAMGMPELIPDSWGDGIAAIKAAAMPPQFAGNQFKSAGKADPAPTGDTKDLPKITDKASLEAAIRGLGAAKDKTAYKAHVVSRAKAIKLPFLIPKGWSAAVTAAIGSWAPNLHPRDRDGQFISVGDLLDVFGGEGFDTPSYRGTAVGNSELGGDKIYLSVKVTDPLGSDHKIGDLITVNPNKVKAAPVAKAHLDAPSVTGPGDTRPRGPYPGEGPKADMAAEYRAAMNQKRPGRDAQGRVDLSSQGNAHRTYKIPSIWDDIAPTGKPEGKGTPDDPIAVNGDLDRAVTLLHEGKSIRLNTEMEASTLVAKLGQAVLQAKADGVDAKDFDLCNVSVPGTNLFCAQHIGIERANMPQLKGQAAEGSVAAGTRKDVTDAMSEANIEPLFRQALEAKGISISPATVKASELKASQMQLVGPKVVGMAAAMREGEIPVSPIFVTRDGYILDGHHRWAANIANDLEDGHLGDDDMPVEVLDMDIGEAIDYTNSFARENGLVAKGTGAAAEGVSAPAAPALPDGYSVVPVGDKHHAFLPNGDHLGVAPDEASAKALVFQHANGNDLPGAFDEKTPAEDAASAHLEKLQTDLESAFQDLGIDDTNGAIPAYLDTLNPDDPQFERLTADHDMVDQALAQHATTLDYQQQYEDLLGKIEGKGYSAAQTQIEDDLFTRFEAGPQADYQFPGDAPAVDVREVANRSDWRPGDPDPKTDKEFALAVLSEADGYQEMNQYDDEQDDQLDALMTHLAHSIESGADEKTIGDEADHLAQYLVTDYSAGDEPGDLPNRPLTNVTVPPNDLGSFPTNQSDADIAVALRNGPGDYAPGQFAKLQAEAAKRGIQPAGPNDLTTAQQRHLDEQNSQWPSNQSDEDLAAALRDGPPPRAVPGYMEKLQAEADKRGVKPAGPDDLTSAQKQHLAEGGKTGPEMMAEMRARVKGTPAPAAHDDHPMHEMAGSSVKNGRIHPDEAKKRINEILAEPDHATAHQKLAKLATEFKQGGRQRKRYRELLDQHHGVAPGESTSSKTHASSTAENLRPDNPVKDRLAAKNAPSAPSAHRGDGPAFVHNDREATHSRLLEPHEQGWRDDGKVEVQFGRSRLIVKPGDFPQDDQGRYVIPTEGRGGANIDDSPDSEFHKLRNAWREAKAKAASRQTSGPNSQSRKRDELANEMKVKYGIDPNSFVNGQFSEVRLKQGFYDVGHTGADDYRFSGPIPKHDAPSAPDASDALDALAAENRAAPGRGGRPLPTTPAQKADSIYDRRTGQVHTTGMPPGVTKKKVPAQNLEYKSSSYRSKATNASEIYHDGEWIGTIQAGQVGSDVLNGRIRTGWASESSGYLAFDANGKEVRGPGLTFKNQTEALHYLLHHHDKNPDVAKRAAEREARAAERLAAKAETPAVSAPSTPFAALSKADPAGKQKILGESARARPQTVSNTGEYSSGRVEVEIGSNEYTFEKGKDGIWRNHWISVYGNPSGRSGTVGEATDPGLIAKLEAADAIAVNYEAKKAQTEEIPLEDVKVGDRIFHHDPALGHSLTVTGKNDKGQWTLNNGGLLTSRKVRRYKGGTTDDRMLNALTPAELDSEMKRALRQGDSALVARIRAERERRAGKA